MRHFIITEDTGKPIAVVQNVTESDARDEFGFWMNRVQEAVREHFDEQIDLLVDDNLPDIFDDSKLDKHGGYWTIHSIDEDGEERDIHIYQTWIY